MTRLILLIILLIVLGTGLAYGGPMDDLGFGSGLEEPSLMPASSEFVFEADQEAVAPGEGTMLITSAPQNLVVRPLDLDPGIGGEPIPEPATVSLILIAGALIAWKSRQK